METAGAGRKEFSLILDDRFMITLTKNDTEIIIKVEDLKEFRIFQKSFTADMLLS